MQFPEGFPLESVDTQGRRLAPGDTVKILAASSCARELPKEDQDRLLNFIGHSREIIEIDRFGFVWLSFSATESSADFCLLPSEVASV